MAVSAETSRSHAKNRFAIVLAVLMAALILLDVGLDQGARKAALFSIGLAMGITLYASSFGFSGSWRAFLSEGHGAGLRGQMLMLAIACLLFFPAIEARELFGHRVGGFVAPVGLSVAVGAFLFGIGMQLGGACASGTLFTVGGGNSRMAITLLFFVIGSVAATHHLGWWLALPSFGPVSVIRIFGAWPALVMALALFGGIAALSVWIEHRKHGRLISHQRDGDALRHPLWRGAWPWIWGAIALALLNYATLALAGRPWGITSAFALWGAQGADTLGIPVGDWDYWQRRTGALSQNLLADTTSLMNFGIMIGALAAAGIAGKFSPGFRIGVRPAAAAVIGGLLLGYGARLAFGCNIGSFFSGTASGSLHGILWLACAGVGNLLALRLRPLFGL
ncbi:YeeE/YedE family protein [Hwanghaeella grinnelliae]|uniref:YeeE/YedE family protein n=1 Tax=Hwanghaeella grinnelliae TaxID=2500179 RepID=A0A3S2W7P4_9PROT|nr:YeeE/YedE family protein [Hwanghaeella grinnelliae]RVU34792.1 YeeE/YedE family protein [Hwanghaeella grinnelliae]